MPELAKYQALNARFRDKVIFHVGAEAEFYSEFNNMVLAMLDCLLRKRRLIIYSRDANFGYDQGWTDFFRPFCDEVTGKFHHRYNLRMEDPFFRYPGFWPKLRMSLFRITHRHTRLTFDMFDKMRGSYKAGRTYEVPALGLDGSLREVLGELARTVYRFNEPTQKDIDGMLAPLGLPAEYVGFHIRGGDKFVEYRQVEAREYIAKAEAVTPLREAFVFTDDYRIFDEMRRDFPGWRFHTLASPAEDGYFHEAFVRQDAAARRRAMVRMFASMEALCLSDTFVGTFSSNPGMFLGMVRDRTYGVDYDKWLLW